MISIIIVYGLALYTVLSFIANYHRPHFCLIKGRLIIFASVQFCICCRLGEHGIRKGLDVNFMLINQSNGSYLHYSKIDYIKFYSGQLNSQFQFNSKSASICNACILNRRM